MRETKKELAQRANTNFIFQRFFYSRVRLCHKEGTARVMLFDVDENVLLKGRCVSVFPLGLHTLMDNG